MEARTASHDVAGPVRSAGPGIGAKISAVVAGLLVLLVVAVLLLLQQVAATSAAYGRLVADEVADARLAQEVRLAHEEQGRAWQDLLLAADPQALTARTATLRARAARADALAASLAGRVEDPLARADLEAARAARAELVQAYDRELVVLVRTAARDVRAADEADAAVRGPDVRAAERLAAGTARLETVVGERTAARDAAVARQRQLVVLLGGVGVVALLLLLVVFVVRVVRPIRTVTAAAVEIARERLPEAVRRIAASEDGDPPPVLEPVTVATGDELADLAAALTGLQDAAVGLAVEQHRRERESADMLLNLGRRNQALLTRVQAHVTDLERVTQDPAVMAAAFRIDRSTARVRRNAASILVLAGAPPAPSRAQPVPLTEVVRAALAEIEEGVRVELHHLEEAAVPGAVAPDLAHLLAELLENATTFSSPVSRVVVGGVRVPEGYRLRVVDQGIGMTRDELDLANSRIRRVGGQVGAARLLGLHVVGRLAARHDVEVVLEASAGHGITASVLVPQACLVAGGTSGGRSDAQSGTQSGTRSDGQSVVLDVTAWDGAGDGEARRRS